MAGKYRIEAVFSLNSELAPEGYLGGMEDDVLDYEDSSSWDTPSFTAEGGVVDFTVEADSEEEARETAQHVIDGAYWSESDGIGWEIEDYSISSIECIEEPMNDDRAKALLLQLVTRVSSVLELTEAEQEALRYVIERLTP